MSRYAIRRRRFLISLYTHPSILYMRAFLSTLLPDGYASNPHAILYGKDIVKRKCHRNVRAFHPISLKKAWIVTKLGHFQIFSQYPCVTAVVLWYPQWTVFRFFWLAVWSPAPQSRNIKRRSAAGIQPEAASWSPIYRQSGTGTSFYLMEAPDRKSVV